MSEKTVFLVNPASQNGATGRRWPALARRAEAAGLRGEALLSERPGHLTELAREAAAGGARLLVAVGGDGTVFEAANGLAGAEGVELGLIPLGTGWDFARTHQIPRGLDQAVAVVRDGAARAIDLGLATYTAAEGSEETAYFANVASVGMSGAVAWRVNETTKALGAKASYLLATLAVFSRWRNVHLRVSVDGETREGPMEDAVVALGRYLAGGMKICPDAEPDDGLFDVLLIGDVTRRELLAALPKIYRGTHLPHPKGELLRGRSVTVNAAAPLPLQLDGEQPGTTPVRFEVVPRALRLRVPG